MSANSLIVRWQGGWSERTAPGPIATDGRREGLLTIGAIGTAAEADRIADRQLDIFANVREEVTADVEPRTDVETPCIGYLVGDLVTVPSREGPGEVERVVSVTVSEDDDGYITYAPQFKDIIYEQQGAFDEWLKKMANGTMGGKTGIGSPQSL